MDRTETFNVAINPTESYSKTVCEQTYSATIASQNVECRTNIETEKHKAKVGVTYLLEGSQECYKGEFPNISDLSSLKAYEGDYADIYETQTRWKYTNGAWLDTQEPTTINHKIVTTEDVSTEIQSNTVPKRDNTGNIFISEPTEDSHAVTKQYLQQEIEKAIEAAANGSNKTYVKEFTKSDFKTLGNYSVHYISIEKSEHGLSNPYVGKILARCMGDDHDRVQFLEPIIVQEKVFVDGSIKIYINVALSNYSEYSGKIYLIGE